MSFDITVTLVVAGAVVVLFLTEALGLATTALLAAGALLVAGVVTVEEAFSGFSNTATVTVAAMFVLSAGLNRTGAMTIVGRWLGNLLETQLRLGLAALMLGTAVLSAFINNTAVVAVMLPIVIKCAGDHDISPSKLLIPLSFASMFGGTCTLIGTSTNLLVSSVAEDLGYAPISMFELAPVGLAFVAAGLVFLLTVGPRLLTARREGKTLSENFEVADYVTDVVLEEGSASIGRRIDEAPLFEELDLDVIAVFRDDLENPAPSHDVVLQEGDLIRVRCALPDLDRMRSQPHVRLSRAPADRERATDQTVFVEAVVAPQSELAGKRLGEANLRDRFGVVVLAVRHRGSLSRERMDALVINAGDALLLEVPKERVPELQRAETFVLVSQVPQREERRDRMVIAIAILGAVVGLAATGILPIAATASTGAVLMVLTGCLRQDEAIESIDWNVIFLLAGILPLGIAITKTGADEMIGDMLVHAAGSLGPIALISALYVITAALTSFLSNNGTAVLLTPIAAAAATSLDIDPRPAILAVAFGASTAFATPVGYQTNTLVYSAGNYRFADFVKIGGPLVLLFWLLATLLIPVVWQP